MNTPFFERMNDNNLKSSLLSVSGSYNETTHHTCRCKTPSGLKSACQKTEIIRIGVLIDDEMMRSLFNESLHKTHKMQ